MSVGCYAAEQSTVLMVRSHCVLAHGALVTRSFGPRPFGGAAGTIRPMDLGLDGRIAVVTGGSQGIGREIALTLAREGADVVVAARRRPPLDEVVEQITACGRDALAVTADVATADGVDRLMEAVLARFGRVDILVNNAGKGAPKRMLDLTDDDWKASIELNLMSAVRLS